MRSPLIVSKESFEFPFFSDDAIDVDLQIETLLKISLQCGSQACDIIFCCGRETFTVKMLKTRSIDMWKNTLDVLETLMEKRYNLCVSSKRLGGTIHVTTSKKANILRFQSDMQSMSHRVCRVSHDSVLYDNVMTHFLCNTFPKPRWLYWDQSVVVKLSSMSTKTRKACREEIVTVETDNNAYIWIWIRHFSKGLCGYVTQEANFGSMRNSIRIHKFSDWETAFFNKVVRSLKTASIFLGFFPVICNIRDLSHENQERSIHTWMTLAWCGRTLNQVFGAFSDKVNNHISTKYRNGDDFVKADEMETFMRRVAFFLKDTSPGIHNFDPLKRTNQGGVVVSLNDVDDLTFRLYDTEWNSDLTGNTFVTCCTHTCLTHDPFTSCIDCSDATSLPWNKSLHQVRVVRAVEMPKNFSVMSCARILWRRRHDYRQPIHIAIPTSSILRSKMSGSVGPYNYDDVFDVDIFASLPLACQIQWVEMMAPCKIYHDIANQQIHVLEVGKFPSTMSMSDHFSHEGTSSFLHCIGKSIQPWCEDIYSFANIISNRVFPHNRAELIRQIQHMKDRHGCWKESMNMTCESHNMIGLARSMGIREDKMNLLMRVVPDVLNVTPRIRTGTNFKNRLSLVIDNDRRCIHLNDELFELKVDLGSLQELVLTKNRCRDQYLKLTIERYVRLCIWEPCHHLLVVQDETPQHIEMGRSTEDDPVRITLDHLSLGHVVTFLP
jgi:hypothetical protein